MALSAEPLPELLKLDNQLCFSIYAASRAITRAYRPILNRYQLTYPQYLVLLTLWETDGQSVNAIGRRLYLDSGTLTPLLKKLEQIGYVERRKDLEDDRRVAIHLTPKGRGLQQEAIQIPLDLIRDSRLDAGEAFRVKVMVDGILEKMLDCHHSERGETVDE